MKTFETFKNKYPRQKMTINRNDFYYRYYKNEKSNKTIVLLTGGIGLSDLLLLHFEAFAKSYSDYHIAYTTNQELVDAIAELLKMLKVKVFLVGQSLGGFIAQILAQQYPELIEGLILSNTGTLSVDMDEKGAQSLYYMIKRLDKSIFLIKFMPFGLVKKSIKRAVMKKTNSRLSEQEQIIMSEICDEMVRTLTRDYEIHMILLLKDLQNHWNMKESDFINYKNKVLLILSDDDFTFNDNVKQALTNIMPSPKVITDIRGGHIALLLKLDKYVQSVVDFINSLE